jgi:pimeloyl-ACP methyl ester carboxylesterase
MSTPFTISIGKDRNLHGDFFPSQQDSLGLLIICHGFKGFKDWGFFPYVAQEFSYNYDVITFNFTHNGIGEDLISFTELEKFAKNSYSYEIEDLHNLIQSIKNKQIPSIKKDLSAFPIFLLGHSRGAGVSLIYSFEYPTEITGVISWNGISNVDLFSEEIKNEMRNSGRSYILNGRTNQQMPLDLMILEDIEANKERFDILERVKSSTVPITLIQGSEDFERLREGSATLLANQPSLKWIHIPGGNHTFGAVHPFQGITKPLQEAIVHTRHFLQSLK